MKKIGPVLILLLVLLVGTGIGWVSGTFNTDIANTGPWQMEITYQGIYVQAVADAYAKNPAGEGRAIEQLSYLCQTDGSLAAAFDQARKRYSVDPSAVANLDQLNSLVKAGKVKANADVNVCNTRPVGGYSDILQYAWALVILIAAAIVGYGVLIVIRENEEGPAAAPGAPKPAVAVAGKPAAAPAGGPERAKSTVPAGTPLPAGVPPAKSVAAAGAKISATLEKTDFTGQGVTAPIVQFMTTYLHGDDLYDDSFSIETSSGEFLGETGVGISETVNAPGEAKKVTAFEVWLFDKNDIRTVTKVLMSDHAFNDDAIRAKLAPKGEAVLIKAGDKVTLETASLRVQARIVDLSYGTGPVPPNSFFERITIELAAWKREGAPAPASAGSPPSGLPSI